MKRTQALPRYFGSIYGDFGHAAIDNPESEAVNPKTMLLTFDLTLALHVTFLRKLCVLIRNVLARAFDPRFARPSATLGSGDNRGGGVNITPSPAMRVRRATPAGRRLVEAERSRQTSHFQPKTFCPDSIPPPLYKDLAPPLLDRFFSNFGSRRGNQKFRIPT